jgi:hypothetical protein
MENRPIDSLQKKGEMFNAGRHEIHTALVYYKFLIFHSELYFSAHFKGIMVIATELYTSAKKYL